MTKLSNVNVKHVVAQNIKREILRLNVQIDKKIIRGLSYQKEAQRHKKLVAMLNTL